MSVKTLKIDGIDVAIESGSTILQAAQAAAIEIPTLCYLKGVSAVGACRLCMVEIVGASKLFAACVTQVEEGMEVSPQPQIARLSPDGGGVTIC